MNPILQNIINLLKQSGPVQPEIARNLKELEKEISIIEFKLERTEKVKKTTAILLEETINELEQKRKLVERQNRDAQIEFGLERVRDRTMAMHRSEELLDVIIVMAEQFQQLKFKFDNVSFGIHTSDYDLDFWMAPTGVTKPFRIHVPFLDTPMVNHIREAQKKGMDFFTDVLSAGENKHWLHHLFDNVPLDFITEETKDYLFKAAGYARSTAIMKNLFLTIGNYSATPYTDEENSIFRRFAKVFEQSHTRFLDLQKAEAQGREAQIELGLERVRARAMAMQNSEELNELIGTVFTELTKLDLELTRSIIMIIDAESGGFRWWMANSEEPSSPRNYLVKYHEHPPYLAYYKAWEERQLRFQYELEGDIKKQWDDYIFRETELSRLPEFVIQGMKAPERVWLSASFNNFGCLTVASLEPLSDEHFDILLRFGKVFDLTYTRFNDLKQAEAQAREGGCSWYFTR